MTYTAGIDMGSTYAKAIVMNEEGQIVGKGIRATGFNLPKAAREVYDKALEDAGLQESDVVYVASTGYGRYMVDFRDIQITELTCHAKGAVHQFPGTRTVLDVGGQTIKAIKLDENRKVKSFRLNDKCAAGTGAFLEKTARYMGFSTEDIGPLALKSKNPVTVSSVCAVFAESEVINHLTTGVPAEDIMNGAIISLGGRAVQLMKRVGMEPEFTFAGGMALMSAMVSALEEHLKTKVNVPEGDLGMYNGAIGAAVLAQQRVRKLKEAGEWESRVRGAEAATTA